jgi:hypothetical protein
MINHQVRENGTRISKRLSMVRVCLCEDPDQSDEDGTVRSLLFVPNHDVALMT